MTSPDVVGLAQRTLGLTEQARAVYMAAAIRKGQLHRNYAAALSIHTVIAYALLLHARWTVAAVEGLLRGLDTVEQLRPLVAAAPRASAPLAFDHALQIEPGIYAYVLPVLRALDASAADRVEAEFEGAYSSV